MSLTCDIIMDKYEDVLDSDRGSVGQWILVDNLVALMRRLIIINKMRTVFLLIVR